MGASAVDLIMPVEEPFALQLVHGVKRYEIRTRPLRAPEGTRVWVYASASSRTSGIGAVLGSIVYGGCHEISTVKELREIALEAAATYPALRAYLHERWPAWALRVQMYTRLREPLEITIPGQGIRRFPDRHLLRRLKAADAWQPRRPLSAAALRTRRSFEGNSA